MSIIVDFYGEMSLFELIKQIHKFRNDPFHYNFHEALDLLVDTLDKNNLKYACNLAKYIQKSFREDNCIPIDTSNKLKQIYKHLKRSESVLPTCSRYIEGIGCPLCKTKCLYCKYGVSPAYDEENDESYEGYCKKGLEGCYNCLAFTPKTKEVAKSGD